MEVVYRLEALKSAAMDLIEAAKGHTVWAFYGDMGAGKTTLIHAVCRELGITGTLSSPTFSIINEYASAGTTVYHIDLYRCADEQEAIRAGVEDCLYSGNLCLVEWPARAPGIFPAETLRVSITVIAENTRRLTF